MKARRLVLLHLVKSVVIGRGPRQRKYVCTITWTDVGQIVAPGTPLDGQQVYVPTRVACYG